jgi:hypothetical protein
MTDLIIETLGKTVAVLVARSLYAFEKIVGSFKFIQAGFVET